MGRNGRKKEQGGKLDGQKHQISQIDYLNHENFGKHLQAEGLDNGWFILEISLMHKIACLKHPVIWLEMEGEEELLPACDEEISKEGRRVPISVFLAKNKHELVFWLLSLLRRWLLDRDRSSSVLCAYLLTYTLLSYLDHSTGMMTSAAADETPTNEMVIARASPCFVMSEEGGREV